MVQLSKNQISEITIAGIVALIFAGLLWKSAGSKEEPIVQIPNAEPRDVTDELSRPSDVSTVDLNLGSDKNDGWNTYDVEGGKKSRKRRKNKTRKSRSKSKRTKK